MAGITAGINHFAWFLQIGDRWGGLDLYPAVRDACAGGVLADWPLTEAISQRTGYLLSKSLSAKPCRYCSGKSSETSCERRATKGRIRLSNRSSRFRIRWRRMVMVRGRVVTFGGLPYPFR
ncbi:MAG: hypothetical protein IMX01_07575 [Limnochordaceae bacterium]|nr:hypothetical protein [Limnochordaceae bacterium]